MSSLKDIKKRMKSIKDIHKVTRAMKMVSVAKLRKSEKDLEEVEIRYKKLECIFFEKFLSLHKTDMPELLLKNKEDRIIYILINSDKGLCGAFNKNVFKAFTQLYRDKENLVCAIGKKAITFSEREKFPIYEKHLFPDESGFYKFSQSFVFGILEKFKAGEIDTLKVIFNKNVSPVSQKVQVEQLIPLEVDKEKLKDFKKSKHMCEPSDFQFTEKLIQELIIAKLFYILKQSVIAEHTARMNAMDAASDNASELLDELTISYNKARQAAITKEILEIAGTAEALKG